MEIQFLGTGAGSPGKFRNVTSTALRLLDERNSVWLFDVGEATQHQILRTTLKPRKIDKIFITHLHGDHIFGLPGLLSSRSFQGGNEPLTIYGPKGIRDFVEVSMRVSETKLSYKIHYRELSADGMIFEDDKFRVYAQHLDHRIECFGYRVVEKDHPGELMVDKLREAQIPSGPVYGELKAGKTVTLPDGRTVSGADFLGPSQPGRIVALLGDTRQTRNAARLTQDADVLVHESTFAKGESKLARAYYHSTNIQAAELAKRTNVKMLLLNHISARYTGKMALELQQQAREVFKNTRVVKDFDEYNVPFQKITAEGAQK
ncbi:ribonuclease Z [Levilactobacillus parabrevis]|uniref:Ribonuclease Z n=1 Tax=Levilactobacillus parabrevis ATCC 53295 TaxID=1267003 RepID=A0A0R1GL91_9LACO|nr:ribonuclease Z [Levilactobacillus parabrevis]KRK34853.1 beta-lactamase superfamily hydrolase [Levilactobacillus parabrevis ATCC 53295]KRO05015.1 beta-lactamase superfamily hydrolase [Levilactobacillus parabrevis]MCT4487066.1 ribonuclease Z [Levilactobacillus parabrevis]MCT4489940.1 ribonuclease Z [Levilactobacillus parabrevis]